MCKHRSFVFLFLFHLKLVLSDLSQRGSYVSKRNCCYIVKLKSCWQTLYVFNKGGLHIFTSLWEAVNAICVFAHKISPIQWNYPLSQVEFFYPRTTFCLKNKLISFASRLVAKEIHKIISRKSALINILHSDWNTNCRKLASFSLL